MANTKKKKGRRHTGLIIILILLLLAAALLLDSNTRLTTSEYELSFKNLPAAFNGYKIVQLSDFHLAEFGQDNAKLVERVRELEPDIITITGDLIDDVDQEEYLRSFLPELVAEAPVYYVTGNHEWASGDIRDMFDVLDECGVTVLRNDYRLLTLAEDSLILAGADDPNGPYDMEQPDHLVSRIREAEGDKFLIMLYHRNDKLELFSSLGVDLMLCGHAHGGLIRLPFTDGLIDASRNWFPTYTAGPYTEGGATMVVSRGLGNTGRTFRFLNNPDIVSVTLKSVE